MKNIPKIAMSIIIGYSNLSIFESLINIFDELITNKLDIKINILKKLEKSSKMKLSIKIFLGSFGELIIIAEVIIITIEDKLNTRLKLFLLNTPIINIKKIDKVKNISGASILKLLIIFC